MPGSIRTILSPYVDDLGQPVICILALKGNEIIGSLYASRNQNNSACLENIQVNPPYRGQGIGSMLLNKLTSTLKSQGINEITGEMKPEYGIRYDKVQNFYEKNGFKVDQDYNLSRRV